MGKRSNFERVERDFYPTPREAVAPLIDHLPPQFFFAEPCAGDGALIRHIYTLYRMTGRDVKCIFASDIEPPQDNPWIDNLDVFNLTIDHVKDCDYIITNPPWKRKLLHPIIEHLCHLRPTWLLFDASWPYTKQSSPYMHYLQKIVAVGRVKWFEDSKWTGKEDCAWYLFDANNTEQTRFYGR